MLSHLLALWKTLFQIVKVFTVDLKKTFKGKRHMICLKHLVKIKVQCILNLNFKALKIRNNFKLYNKINKLLSSSKMIQTLNWMLSLKKNLESRMRTTQLYWITGTFLWIWITSKLNVNLKMRKCHQWMKHQCKIEIWNQVKRIRHCLLQSALILLKIIRLIIFKFNLNQFNHLTNYHLSMI